MSKIKHELFVLLMILACYQLAECKTIKKSISDYDSQSVYSDYFDTTATESAGEDETSTIKSVVESTETETRDENEDEADDDGVTCSASNVTKVLSAFEVENFVLVLFRLNVTANERELVFFLNLAKRFSEATALFVEHRFIVVTTDQSSEIVRDFIENEAYPNEIIVIDDGDYPDLGFVVDFDELHVYIVDPCGEERNLDKKLN
jgi:hypothetical protein